MSDSREPQLSRLLLACLVAGGAAAGVSALLPRGPQQPGHVSWPMVGWLLVGLAIAPLLRKGPARGRFWAPLGASVAGYLVPRFMLDLPSTRPNVGALLGGSQYAVAGLTGPLLDALLWLPFVAVVIAGAPHVRWGRKGEPRPPTHKLELVALAILLLTQVPFGFVQPPRYSTWEVSINGCPQIVYQWGSLQPGRKTIVFLSGGPGGTELGTLQRQWGPISEEFRVLVWDQTGAGANGHCFQGPEDVTLERLRSDAIVLLERVNLFNKHVILVGNSWGTFLGTLVAAERPDLIEAYVGTGQMVDLTETDRRFYADTLAWARGKGDARLVSRLERQGPPPYASVYDYEPVFAHEGDWNAWDRDPGVASAVNPVGNVWGRPEMPLLAKGRYLQNLVDSFAAVYPSAQGHDLRREVRQLQVPVYLAAGDHEARGRSELAREWFDALQAPRKEWVPFARSGHKPFGEQPEEFRQLLRRV